MPTNPSLAVDVTDKSTVGVLVLNAMAAHATKNGGPAKVRELFDVAPGGVYVTVTMQVNDKPVDIIATLEDTWTRMAKRIDEMAEEKARTILKDAGLTKIVELTEQLTEAFNDQIDHFLSHLPKQP